MIAASLPRQVGKVVKRLLKTGALRQLAGILGAMVFVRYGALWSCCRLWAVVCCCSAHAAGCLGCAAGCQAAGLFLLAPRLELLIRSKEFVTQHHRARRCNPPPVTGHQAWSR